MGKLQNFSCCRRNRDLMISLILLLVSSFIAQGREISESKSTRAQFSSTQSQKEYGGTIGVRSLIGSMPPRCATRCRNCGHCEAIQVPITTQVIGRRGGSVSFFSRRRRSPLTDYSRGDDISNYKPMSWKCKCGNMIFNP